MHAAALHPELFTSVTLRQAPRDWASVVGDPHASGQLESVIHGVLKSWDLPDLVRLTGSEKVRFED